MNAKKVLGEIIWDKDAGTGPLKQRTFINLPVW